MHGQFIVGLSGLCCYGWESRFALPHFVQSACLPHQFVCIMIASVLAYMKNRFLNRPELGLFELGLISALLFIAACFPIVSVQLPPLGDYANHLARMHVIAHIGDDKQLAQYFSVNWGIIPNLAMDVLVPPLLHVMDVFAAGQLFVILVVFLLVSGPMFLSWTIWRQLTLAPLLAFGFIYNGFFMLGLMNYLFGVGLAIWASAIWIRCRHKPWWLIVLQSAVFTVALFLCHLYAVGLYLLAIGSYELWDWQQRHFRFDLRLFLTGGLFAALLGLVLILLLNGPTWGLSGVYDWDDQGKIEGIAQIFRLYDDKFDLVIMLAFLAGLGAGLRLRILHMHPAGTVCLVLGLALYLAMPATLFGSMMADQRLPIAVLLFAFGFVRIDLPLRTGRLVFIAVLICLCMVRFGEVASRWHQIDDYVQEFRQAIKMLPRGARVIVAQADEADGPAALNDGMSHIPCLAVIDRSALVATLFTVSGKQILGVRHPYSEIVDRDDGFLPSMSQLNAAEANSPPNDPFWATWFQDHDYVFEMFGAPDSENPNPDRLELVYRGSKFHLFRIIKDASDEDEKPENTK